VTTPVRTAVILAAGSGRRLGERGREVPKGFLRLGERPIIEESLERLRSIGIERVVIATGHLSHYYEELSARYDGLIHTVHNPDFARSGSLVSLWATRDEVTEDCLLLESDIVYERRALTALLDAEADDVILLSGPTGAGDEVWVSGSGGRLLSMSKQRSDLDGEILGELVGICRVSTGLMADLLRFAEEGMRTTLDLDYEMHGLVAAAKTHLIRCELVEDLAWCEIDDAAHLARAATEVYPRLRDRETPPASG
jgi:2-aminoethylphosphonate-pyruvate transaminase